MNSITNNSTRTTVAALAAFALIAVSAVVAIAPTAHAADLGFDEYSGGGGYDYGDQYSGGYGYSDQYAGGYGYSDQYAGGNGYDTTSGYYDQYSGGNPSYDYGSGYSGCSSCGGSGFGGSGFSGFGGFGGGSSSTFAPTTVSNNVPTTIYAPSNTNICTGGNVCNTTTTVDDHSIFNAPTTVTVSGGGSGNSSYPVYVPVYQQQNYPVYNTPCCANYQQPVVYPVTRQPYVSLNQVPYTGLDLGPVGTVVYWGFLVLWCLVAAYLIVYKRVQTKVVSGLNTFLFGPKVGTHAKVVMPVASHSAHAVAKAYVAPVAKNDDAIDPFIASQIARNK